MQSDTDQCGLDAFSTSRDILWNSDAPIFILPGNDDWLNCPTPNQAILNWGMMFDSFESQWKPDFTVERSSEKPIFFSMVQNDILYLGTQLMAGPIWDDSNEWDELLLDNLRWVVRMIQKYRDDVQSIVLMGHAALSSDHVFFTENFSRACESWQIPILYLHAGNTYRESRGEDAKSFDCKFMTEVQVEKGSRVPPLKVVISNDDPLRFRFDRRR